MSFNWGGLVRVLAPRIIGAAASGLAGLVFTKTHGAVSLDPTQLTELGTTMILTYGVTHTAASAKINPVGAASPVVAQEGVEVKKTLVEEAKTTPQPENTNAGH
jgi:uncharacterized membrane protein